MTEDLKNIKSRTIFSVLSLFFQSGYSAFLGLIANLILTILLSPLVFGMYITVLSIISLFNYFSDIGLAAALIQKKDITDEDIKTTFTIQQLLIITLITIGFLATNFVGKFYKLPREGIYLYWGVLIGFFISSLKTIPSVFLERKVHYHKIVIVQIIENTVFYITATILAILKFGIMSFTYAVIMRAIVGLIVIYSISFWIPKIGVSVKSLKKLLTFGVPFQASSFLALFKDDLITLFLGKVIGFTGLGYIGWAKKWAEAPIRIIMDNVSRVLFPVISRLQHDKDKIGRLMEKIIYYQTLLLAPIILGLALIMPSMISILPKYSKWAPALPYFYIFCVSAFLSSYSSPFMNLFNALGKVKISFSFMLFWTIITWIFTPLLTKIFGLYGFPVTQIFLSLTFVAVIIQANKIVRFDFIKSVDKAIFSSLMMGAFALFFLIYIPRGIPQLILTSVIAITSYFILLKYLFKIDLITEVKSLFFK